MMTSPHTQGPDRIARGTGILGGCDSSRWGAEGSGSDEAAVGPDQIARGTGILGGTDS
jgi:hypothetical protein